jgi:hypothetical protein
MDGTEPIEVEVRVHRGRRRRTDRPPPDTPRPPNLRNLLIYAGLTGVVAALMFEGYLSHKPRDQALPRRSEATEVTSAIFPAAESLQVVVSWDLTLSTPEGQPDSIRIKVVPAPGNDSLIAMQPATVFADTAYLPAPAPGQTLTGASCVVALHAVEPLTEVCTPWQYVRPTATAEAGLPVPGTIVIQPAGLQVDPDVGGRCAAWQRTHPGESVWIVVNRVALVNRVAIRECTGVNGKPTVAQFCAFIVLSDGRKVKTANSANNSYCEELFVEWTRERYS